MVTKLRDPAPYTSASEQLRQDPAAYYRQAEARAERRRRPGTEPEAGVPDGDQHDQDR